jgi:serine/threonine protein kinase
VRKSDGMTVAIKVMLAKIAVNEKTRRLFLREIDITRQLDHPHIVSLLDSGAAGSAFYFIMDYCGGGSIEHLVQRHGNKLPLPLAAPLLLQCLDGLEYAHQAGIIHRDLKPQNILLDNRDGQTMARIADFGLAKSMASAGLSGMTATGTYGGSYRFMPREQIVSFKFFRPVSDLWSLVATFYNILTGQFALDFPPDRDPVDIVLSEQAVPLRQRDASMPPAVAKVIDRALLPTVENRYQSAAELKQALQRALGRSPR